MGFVLNALKWLSIAVLLSSYKSLPGSYYVRFYSILIRTLFWSKDFRKSNVLHHISRLDTFCSFGECDFYLHKSNSTFLEEMDMSRTRLMIELFKPLFAIEKFDQWPFLPVASVDISFVKEIKPLQRYVVDSSVIAFDEKWLYVKSEFKIASPKGERVCSTAITKYVFKDPKTRGTIAPGTAVEKSGLVYDEQDLQANYDKIKHFKPQLTL